MESPNPIPCCPSLLISLFLIKLNGVFSFFLVPCYQNRLLSWNTGLSGKRTSIRKTWESATDTGSSSSVGSWGGLGASVFTAPVNDAEHMQGLHSLSLRGELVDSNKLKLSLSSTGGRYLYNKEKCWLSLLKVWSVR